MQPEPEVLRLLTIAAAPKISAIPRPTMIAIPQDTLPINAPIPITIIARVARPLPALPVNHVTTVQSMLPTTVSELAKARSGSITTTAQSITKREVCHAVARLLV